jgi:2-dehydropantoate 2-reductase
MAEIERIARARGIALPPGRIEATLKYVDALPPDGTVSLQRDLAAGLPSEIEAWSGAVVRLGREVGVDAPIHRIAYAAVQPTEQRARSGVATRG